MAAFVLASLLFATTACVSDAASNTGPPCLVEPSPTGDASLFLLVVAVLAAFALFGAYRSAHAPGRDG